MKVRFPNEYYYDEIVNFDFSQFELNNTFSDVVFGWYKGSFLELNRDDYEAGKIQYIRQQDKDVNRDSGGE